MLAVLPLIYCMMYPIILLFLIVFAFMVKKDTCRRGALQCKWTDLCDGRTQQHYCIFQPMGPIGPLSGRLFRRLSGHLYGRGQRPPPGILSIRNSYFTEKRQCIQGRSSCSSNFKGTVSQDFLLRFFHESSSPKPPKIA